MPTKIIICLDGCGPEYLAQSETPNFDALAAPVLDSTGLLHNQKLLIPCQYAHYGQTCDIYDICKKFGFEISVPIRLSS